MARELLLLTRCGWLTGRRREGADGRAETGIEMNCIWLRFTFVRLLRSRQGVKWCLWRSSRERARSWRPEEAEIRLQISDFKGPNILLSYQGIAGEAGASQAGLNPLSTGSGTHFGVRTNSRR